MFSRWAKFLGKYPVSAAVTVERLHLGKIGGRKKVASQVILVFARVANKRVSETLRKPAVTDDFDGDNDSWQWD